MLWKAQSPFSIEQWLRVLDKKKTKQGNKNHARIWFSFWLWTNKKKKNVRNSWMGLGISSSSLATVWDACRSSWTLQKHKRSKESDNDEHSSVTFMLTNGQCDIFGLFFLRDTVQAHAMQSEWGYNWLRQKSIRPAERERVLIINHSLMQKARNDAPKKVDQTELDRKQVK